MRVIALGDMSGAPALLRHNIKLWMIERGMNQTSLAAAAHITQGYVSQILKGHRDLNTDTLQNLADALGIAPWRLWEPKGGRKRTPTEAIADDRVRELMAQVELLNEYGLQQLREMANLLTNSDKYVKHDEKVAKGG